MKTEQILKRLDNIKAIEQVYEAACDKAIGEEPVDIGNCSDAVNYWRTCGLEAVVKYIKTGRKK
jgi:hypothetical protein